MVSRVTHEGGIQAAFLCLLAACLTCLSQRLNLALEIKEHSGCIEMKTCTASGTSDATLAWLDTKSEARERKSARETEEC